MILRVFFIRTMNPHFWSRTFCAFPARQVKNILQGPSMYCMLVSPGRHQRHNKLLTLPAEVWVKSF